MNQDNTKQTIKEVKNLIDTINSKLNQTINMESTEEVDKKMLMKLRDENIETAQLIQKIEMVGLV